MEQSSWLACQPIILRCDMRDGLSFREKFFHTWRIMSARTKLNTVFVGGTLLVAATAGVVTSSWLVFAAITITGTILLIHAGEVRLKPGDHTLTSRGTRRKPPRT